MSKQYPGGIISKTPVTPSGPYENSTASGIWTLDQQAYWQKLGQWPTAGNFPFDPQFNYVTMLLHGDGTNGAQNNTFLDSSSNTFSITRNGNATQGSFSPYGSNWSNYFNGSSSYLSTASNAAYQFGTGDFTIECWINMAAGTSLTSFWRSFVSVCGDAVFTNAVTLYIGDGGAGSSVAGEVAIVIGTDNLRLYGGEDIRNLGWVHVALTRSGTTLRLFVNGTQKSSGTNSSNINATSFGSQIGLSSSGQANYFIGYVSNVRIVKGTAVYTSNFTPSTTPLTAITNTSLLTCADNRFIDDSANNFTITANGTPSVQRFNPFGASTAYSTSVIGGSAYIDNNGYVDCGSQSAYAFGTGDFTINAWIYPTSLVNYVVILDTRGSGGSAGFAFAMDGAKTIYFYSAVSFSVVVTSAVGAVPLNAWTYATVTRTSGTNRLYLNGVLVNTASNSDNYSHTALTCGYSAAGGGERYYGYMSDVQVIKGTAVAPTLPTAPVATSSGTSVLLNMQNAGIFDNAMMNDLETVGNAQISTSVVKYGTGSLAFDGTGDRLVGPATPNMAFGTGDYTIEFWCYPSNTGYGCFIDTRSANPSTDGVSIFNNGTSLEIYSQGQVLTASSAFTLNTWQFFALTRSGTSLRAFVNGTQVGSTVTNSDNQTAGRVMIGDNVGVAYPLNGYIDDLRITKGYARYTANFTPPTAAFFNYGPT